MPPIRTQVSCPQCRMPVAVTLEQLFDVGQDPDAKRRFLSGRFNVIDCPACHFQGQAATLILYHDPAKELLMSYVPMELGLPQAEQERTIGRLMNEVINKLPQEQRKGYLLNPKPALTLQSMLERVLEGEGVTPEMREAQKAKAQLLQQLLSAPEAQLEALVKENDAKLDAGFFQLLAASAESVASGGNQAGAQRLAELQAKLVPLTTFGQQIQKRRQNLEAAARDLQALGDKLTPDKLLELVLKADEEKAAAYASLVRQAMDYAFFEALTRRIDRAADAEKERLTRLREVLLQTTQAIDQAMQAQMAEAVNVLRTLMAAPNLEQALAENMPRIDDTFMLVLNANIEAAQKAGRPDALQRLELIAAAINHLLQESAPPEIKFINELLEIDSEAEALAALDRRAAEINQPLVDAMTYIIDSLQQNKQPELAARLETLRGAALGKLMQTNWKK